MNSSYLELFKQMTRAAELLAEKVADYDNSQEDKKHEEIALTMRDDYKKLRERISRKNFNPINITRAEYAKLFVCAYIVSSNLEQQIEQMKTALRGYKDDVLPKLDRIINETTNDEEVKTLASELFE